LEANPYNNSDGKPLASDKVGPGACEEWSYASGVGILLCLAGNSRPDIAFAVHQAARFTHALRSFKLAVRKQWSESADIPRAQGIKALTPQPSTKFKVDCFVAADFGDLFGVEDSLHGPLQKTDYVALT
jgi:hypothetical protein